MPITEMIMPAMGESIHEATVLTWLKQPGDRVEADDSLLEVATDKVDTEVPASQSGILREILVKEGDVAVIGKAICRIEVDQETIVSAPPAAPVEELEAVATLEEELGKAGQLTGRSLPESPSPASSSDKTRFYSPLVLNIAKQEGIGQAELDSIPGTGSEKRVTKHDMLAYVEQRQHKPAAVHQVISEKNLETATNGNGAAKQSATPTPTPAIAISSGQDELIQMDRMRKMIADRMVESKRIAPHVTSFIETDMTAIVRWREKNKKEFHRQYGEGITFTPILIEAVVKAIRDFPLINVQVEGDAIRVKKSINIGMAVALPSGNLIVPVIHNADQYNLIGLAKKVNDLSLRARQNKLRADDLADGTYTISNIGTFGNLMGTPIINQPQVALMVFGAIVKKPAVIETPEGDLIGIRQKMFISHGYDHRVVDGSLGGMFLKRVSDNLEGFDPERKLV